MTDPNTEILKLIKKNKIFGESLEFGVGDSLIRYFDALFFKRFLA